MGLVQTDSRGGGVVVHLADRETKAGGFMGKSSGSAEVEALAGPRSGHLTLMPLISISNSYSGD